MNDGIFGFLYYQIVHKHCLSEVGEIRCLLIVHFFCSTFAKTIQIGFCIFQVDTRDKGVVTATQAASFLKQSGLKESVLSQVGSVLLVVNVILCCEPVDGKCVLIKV